MGYWGLELTKGGLQPSRVELSLMRVFFGNTVNFKPQSSQQSDRDF
jgi:hypothetical protein